MRRTNEQYDRIFERCREVFLKKNRDYGSSWRILRPESLTDQLFIKASRIRSIEKSGQQMVQENTDGEYVALVNYSLIALIQMELPEDAPLEMTDNQLTELYDQEVAITRDLMVAKNHDYGEAWRDMRISSLTDMILMKLLRIKQIEDNLGKTIISEGIDANYRDIINYAVFALIRLDESGTKNK